MLPTAAAYEHPDRAVAWAERYFQALGARYAASWSSAAPSRRQRQRRRRPRRPVHLPGGGSPLHLRSVLKDSKAWQALEEAWHNGAVVAGSSAGAMALCDPMIDPRGGALTLGLGLVEQVACCPRQHVVAGEGSPHLQPGHRGTADPGHRRADGPHPRTGRNVAHRRRGNRCHLRRRQGDLPGVAHCLGGIKKKKRAPGGGCEVVNTYTSAWHAPQMAVPLIVGPPPEAGGWPNWYPAAAAGKPRQTQQSSVADSSVSAVTAPRTDRVEVRATRYSC